MSVRVRAKREQLLVASLEPRAAQEERESSLLATYWSEST